MPKAINIRIYGLENHYRNYWLPSHPSAITWEKLVGYMDNGDEFGEPVPVLKLARATKSNHQTMLKWLKIHKEEQRKSIANRTETQPAEDTVNLQGGVL